MRQLPPELILDIVKADEVPAAFELECKGFPADEVTPIEQFIMRQERAPSLFVGVFIPPSTAKGQRTLVAFASCTRSSSLSFTAKTMKTHDPEGNSFCIQNVVVSEAYQRRGIALALVERIIARVRNDGLSKRLLLICRDYLQPLYAKAGFEYVGVSPVILGARPWDEMRLVLKEPETSSNDQPQSVIGIAKSPSNESPSNNPLGSRRDRPSLRLLSSFPGGLTDVTTDSKGVKQNKFDIICPRTECDGPILKSGAGHLVEKEMPELKIVQQPPSSFLVSIPSAGTKIPCWFVQPSPVPGENIEFSRSVNEGSGSQDAQLKYKPFGCADCDLEPLGWCDEGGHKLWLISDRVGYLA